MFWTFEEKYQIVEFRINEEKSKYMKMSTLEYRRLTEDITFEVNCG